MMKRYRQRGFTLVEISVVMIIIGLLAAAVMIGRDLIQAAGIRSQISQINNYMTAVTAFRTKYNTIPGDMSAAQAAQFLFQARTGNVGDGDYNGYVEQCGPGVFAVSPLIGCEMVLFWSDLSSAGMIEGSFTTPNGPVVIPSSIEASTYFPQLKIADQGVVAVNSDLEYRNWFVLTRLTHVNSPSLGNTGLGPTVPVRTASSIDVKMDDGDPLNGEVKAGYAGGGAADNFFFSPPAQSVNACVYQNVYNVKTTVPTTCYVNIRMASEE